jgi:hypothetical protein
MDGITLARYTYYLLHTRHKIWTAAAQHLGVIKYADGNADG